MGKETEEILAHKHHELEEFGIGEDDDEKIWNPVIRQALIAGYIRKEVENYGLLKITAAGKKFLKSPKSFMIVKDAEFSDDYEAGAEPEGGTGALDPTLSAMLRDLRKKVSKRLERPPYVIFQDVSIDQMATDYPVTLEELKNIQGVGEGKVKQSYAKEFVDLIAKYCEENEIERQMDLRVRTVAKKSMLKVKIIQSIDRQIALDDIANAQGIDFDELLDEIEAIVYSGTKLNIDYFLEEVMDEDHIDDIYDHTFLGKNIESPKTLYTLKPVISGLSQIFKSVFFPLIQGKIDFFNLYKNPFIFRYLLMFFGDSSLCCSKSCDWYSEWRA